MSAPVLLPLMLACTPPGADDTDGAPDDTAPGLTWVTEEAALEEVPGLPAVDVFSETEIHRFALELSSQSVNALRRNPRAWVDAEWVAGGVRYPVGLRLKGSSTFRDFDSKPSMKLEFDHQVEGLRFQGLRKLNLHNLVLDPMLSSETLLYGFFRAAELPAPRVGYARVVINGADRGLFTLVEDPEDAFLERWYDDPDGNLYENAENYCDLTRVSCFDVEEYDEGNHEALQRLIDAAGQRGPAWREAMEPLLDWDRVVGFFAMERTIAHWDSYSFDQSNYRFYHEPTTDTWSLLPWSADLGFGYRPWTHPDCGYHGVDPDRYDMGMLAASCEQDAACIDAVLDRMLEYADLVESMDPGARVTAALDRVRAEASTDPAHRNDMDHFEEHGACVRDFLEARPDVVRAWVAEHR